MTVINLKPRDPAFDPNRKALAAAIALHAGARRDVRVADEAASLAAQKCWAAQARLDELNKAPHSPIGARADAFIASVDAGNPCGTAVLERSSVDARAKISAAENDVNVWKQTHEECDLAVRGKRDAVASAKEGVERCARVVVCNSENVARLVDELAALHGEIINKRVALRYIWGCGLNGELSAADKSRVQTLLQQDLTGLEPHPVRDAWQAAFDELLTDPDARLPGD